MYKLILAATAALLSLTTATPLAERQEHPDQIALGRFTYPHGNQFVAWTPSRTTQQEACRTHVGFSLLPLPNTQTTNKPPFVSELTHTRATYPGNDPSKQLRFARPPHLRQSLQRRQSCRREPGMWHLAGYADDQ